MTDYRSRVADSELAWRMSTMGAILVDGPKAVGKTETASQIARSVIRMDTDRSARAALEVHPAQLFDSATPILFDEWQETPELWNLVRRAVDERGDKGLYLLTGSARPRDDLRAHSGAGRIGRLRMRPMSLFETGHSSGDVSLAALLQGSDPTGTAAELSVPEIIERMVIGGWPALLGQGERAARAWVADYLRTVAEVDVPEMGPRRNPGNILRLFAALARATGAPAKGTTLATEIGGQRGPIATETLSNYLEALDRLMLVEPLPAWRPHMRSRTRLRSTPVQHFVDPSIGIAALGIGSHELLGDLEAAGLHFESLVLRDLRTYAQSFDATLSSWRDSQTGAEVDVVIELPDGTWAAFEIKMGEGAADTAAASLLHFAKKIDKDRHGDPAALVVITAGKYTYRRADGVLVVPITALGP
ncbi:ATP-binding protein [Microbacterium sp. PMB16]|uniref:ATP-binding protein n=1 Tax=Microbacterium sp. PMB16 TaxID=3120157 RepID=UPI003F4BC542